MNTTISCWQKSLKAADQSRVKGCCSINTHHCQKFLRYLQGPKNRAAQEVLVQHVARLGSWLRQPDLVHLHCCTMQHQSEE